MQPARCRFPAASVIPSRRTPSAAAINSCVIVISFEGSRSRIDSSSRHICCSTEWCRLHAAVWHICVSSDCAYRSDTRCMMPARLNSSFRCPPSSRKPEAPGPHDRGARRGIAAHEERDAEHAFVADAGDLGRRSRTPARRAATRWRSSGSTRTSGRRPVRGACRRAAAEPAPGGARGARIPPPEGRPEAGSGSGRPASGMTGRRVGGSITTR